MDSLIFIWSDRFFICLKHEFFFIVIFIWIPRWVVTLPFLWRGMSVYVAFLPRKEIELGFWLSNGDSYRWMKTLNFEKSNHESLKIPKTIGKDVYRWVWTKVLKEQTISLPSRACLSYLFHKLDWSVAPLFFFKCQHSRYFCMLLAGAFLKKKIRFMFNFKVLSFFFNGLMVDEGDKQKNISADVEPMIVVYLWGREIIENILS